MNPIKANVRCHQDSSEKGLNSVVGVERKPARIVRAKRHKSKLMEIVSLRAPNTRASPLLRSVEAMSAPRAFLLGPTSAKRGKWGNK